MPSLSGKQSNIKGAYFAGPPLILQHWKGENQLFEMVDSTTGQPAAMVGRNSFSLSVWITGIANEKNSLYLYLPKLLYSH